MLTIEDEAIKITIYMYYDPNQSKFEDKHVLHSFFMTSSFELYKNLSNIPSHCSSMNAKLKVTEVV
jgi:hypothetical protein